MEKKEIFGFYLNLPRGYKLAYSAYFLLLVLYFRNSLLLCSSAAFIAFYVGESISGLIHKKRLSTTKTATYTLLIMVSGVLLQLLIYSLTSGYLYAKAPAKYSPEANLSLQLAAEQRGYFIDFSKNLETRDIEKARLSLSKFNSTGNQIIALLEPICDNKPTLNLPKFCDNFEEYKKCHLENIIFMGKYSEILLLNQTRDSCILQKNELKNIVVSTGCQNYSIIPLKSTIRML